LSLSGTPEEEVTYFRDRLDKRLIKVAHSHAAENVIRIDKGRIKKNEEEDLLILEDEVEGLKLTILSLKTQLEEQKSISDAAMSGILKEQRLIQEQNKVKQEYYESQVKELMEKLNKMRSLCRENTKGIKF
jgi:hypothetical protein